MEVKDYLIQLKECESKQEFKKIWDTNKFNWNNSYLLCENYSKYFKIWWNAEKFRWSLDSNELCKYCSDYFEIWWDSGKFDWRNSNYLCKYCSDHFKIWWNPKKFDWKWSNYLTVYCSKYFSMWWNPEKFNLEKELTLFYLQKHCKNYKHIWKKDYIKWKLLNFKGG